MYFPELVLLDLILILCLKHIVPVFLRGYVYAIKLTDAA